ncbi:nucleotide triphosphate hydrolase domain-containing protein [Klebsiella variicola]|uniref:Nucleotide triphosphate hydrolase domain-containing protein n=1 Tax=Klebsiella variicola TaxID=244366 RepID=A0A7H4MC94_KLEVA|nr:nucleotide triphosphate hydrolase domain-containing protein [Klebsiella variicola]
MSSPLLIARTLDNALYLLPAMANRHGLITGATGTGKTVTPAKSWLSRSRRLASRYLWRTSRAT